MPPAKDASNGGKDRLAALDIFRGMAVLSLIIFNGFYGFINAPEWLKHAEWHGYTFADLIAPLFLFAVGMSLPISIKKRLEKSGLKSVLAHSAYRGLLMIAFGTIGNIICFRDFSLHWGTLEMIGGCIILSTPAIIWIPPIERVVAGFTLIFSWFLVCFFTERLHSHVILYVMGGPASLIAWSSIVLIGSAISEFFNNRGKYGGHKMILFSTSLISGSIFLFFNILNIPPNKNLVNSPYLSLSIALSCALLLIVDRLQESRILRNLLIPYGENALVMYMLSGILNMLLQSAVPADAQMSSLLPYSLLLIIASSAIIFGLHARKKIIKI